MVLLWIYPRFPLEYTPNYTGPQPKSAEKAKAVHKVAPKTIQPAATPQDQKSPIQQQQTVVQQVVVPPVQPNLATATPTIATPARVIAPQPKPTPSTVAPPATAIPTPIATVLPIILNAGAVTPIAIQPKPPSSMSSANITPTMVPIGNFAGTNMAFAKQVRIYYIYHLCGTVMEK